MSLLDPLVSFDTISLSEANSALVAWGHKMGAVERPEGFGCGAHGLRHAGRLVAVTTWHTLIRKNGAGLDFLPRATTAELSRVCAERPDLCRVALRLWREFVFPALGEARGHIWAISYQDAALHTGNLYRFDGWVPLALSSSGTDQRSGKSGRRKVVWGWRADEMQRRLAALHPRRAA